MTDDLISRAEAIAAIQAAGGGYIMSMEVISALPAADLSSPLGAVAMRDAAIALMKNSPLPFGYKQTVDLLCTIPLPDHAALLAHALRLPEVAALQAAIDAAEAEKARAVEAERERCAVIADNAMSGMINGPTDEALYDLSESIAAAIRTEAKP